MKAKPKREISPQEGEMADKGEEEASYYNLEGGQRNLVLKDGEVKAVAPGLRVVEATDDEKKQYKKKERPKKGPREYGLPV